MKKILLVEDEPGYQELLQMMLSTEFALTVCSSAEDGLTAFKADAYDLVICDINLFGMTGFQLVEAVRHAGLLERCPVVLCSSQHDPETKEKAMASGAASFIPKPFDPEMVLTTVRTLLA